MLVNRLALCRLMFSFGKKTTASKPQNTFENFASDLNSNKDVYAEYQKQAQQDTILRKFRRDVFKKEQISEEVKAYKEDLEKQSLMMDDLLHKGSKEDIIRYSKKIMQKLMNKKKLFKDQTINPMFSDYGDYSSYRTNFVKIEDGNLGNLERLDQGTSAKNVFKFIDELPDDYEQKEMIREQIKEDFQHSNENMSIAEYGKIINERENVEQYMTERKQYLYETYKDGQKRIFRTMNQYIKERSLAPESRMDLQNGFNYPVARLSPHAIDTIYECYLQGWTVRDISKRFGILPRRTKFYIWTRAQLYDQLLPKYGWKYYYEALQDELELGEEYGYVDYGLDLHILQSDRIPESIIEWNPKRVDAQRKQEEYTQALQKLEELQKFDRHQKMQVGTHGKENKMYLLKEWTIFRGKGSDKYHLRNKTFRQLSKAQKKMVKEYY